VEHSNIGNGAAVRKVAQRERAAARQEEGDGGAVPAIARLIHGFPENVSLVCFERLSATQPTSAEHAHHSIHYEQDATYEYEQPESTQQHPMTMCDQQSGE